MRDMTQPYVRHDSVLFYLCHIKTEISSVCQSVLYVNKLELSSMCEYLPFRTMTALQCIVVRCSVSQCAAVCCSVLCETWPVSLCDMSLTASSFCTTPSGRSPLTWTVCCSMLQSIVKFYGVLQCAAVCCSVLQCAAVCCSVLHSVAVCDTTYFYV